MFDHDGKPQSRCETAVFGVDRSGRVGQIDLFRHGPVRKVYHFMACGYEDRGREIFYRLGGCPRKEVRTDRLTKETEDPLSASNPN